MSTRREWASLKKKNDELTKVANIDNLTQIYNRRGGDQAVIGMLEDDSVTKGVLLTLDIDRFKGLNDTYGHGTGDAALVQIVKDMKENFGSKAIYIRNGGDEFVIFCPNTDSTALEEHIQSFADQRHTFWIGEKKISFSVSVGYAEYPSQGKTMRELCQHADIALYNVKMNGRKGYMRYEPSMKDGERSQLSFDLGEVVEKMPGAMLIYRADRTNEEILFANKWLIRMFDCENLNEFMRYTGGTFRGIVHPDDYERVEEEIWHQILVSKEQLDYVQYRILSKDNRVLEVKDYGRLVDSQLYGKIFFVTLNTTTPVDLDGIKINESIRAFTNER